MGVLKNLIRRVFPAAPVPSHAPSPEARSLEVEADGLGLSFEANFLRRAEECLAARRPRDPRSRGEG